MNWTWELKNGKQNPRQDVSGEKRYLDNIRFLFLLILRNFLFFGRQKSVFDFFFVYFHCFEALSDFFFHALDISNG